MRKKKKAEETVVETIETIKTETNVWFIPIGNDGPPCKKGSVTVTVYNGAQELMSQDLVQGSSYNLSFASPIKLTNIYVVVT